MKTVDGAILYGRGQIDHPTQDWTILCQGFVRSCMGVPAWAGTAYDAWLKIPDKHKHFSVIEDAPRGAAIYFKHRTGDPRPGHVVLATKTACLSNDIYRKGHIDVAPRTIFVKRWNMEYLGWSTWTPFGTMSQ